MSSNVTQPETGPNAPEAGPLSPDASPESMPAGAPEAASSQPFAPAAAPFVPPAASAASVGPSRRGEPRTYDFRRPTKLSREHVRVLQIAQEAFARQATTILTTLLRAGARLDLVGIEQFAYDDYVATLPNPVFISTFS